MSAAETPKTGGGPAPNLTTRRAVEQWSLRPLDSPSSSRAPRLVRWLGNVGGWWLGGVLLLAVWAKALDPAAFAQQIHGDGLDVLLPAATVALIALAIEAGLGTALLLSLRRLWVLVPATLLVAFFVALNGRAYWLAAHGQASAAASCGCFGNLVLRTPAEAFWQDLLLLLPALALAWLGRRRGRERLPTARLAIVAVALVGVPLFAWWAPELPLDDLATRLKPGTELAKVCAGAAPSAVCLDSVVPGLGQGNHLVVMDDLEDPVLAKAVARLNAYTNQPSAASVWLLTSSDEAHQRAFFWKWGPAFKIVEVPAELLRPLYRRLPRSFAVQDGRVMATFPGLPPLPPASPVAAKAAAALSPSAAAPSRSAAPSSSAALLAVAALSNTTAAPGIPHPARLNP
jgi:hypothetical protein